MAAYVLVALLLLGISNADSAPTPQYDTIVVGLGSAGVTAATELARAGRRVLGLEAQARVGGRVYTVPFGEGIVELGAEWIHGTEQSRTYDLAMKNNVTVLPQDLKLQLYQSDGTIGDSALIEELLVYLPEVLFVHSKDSQSFADYMTTKLTDYIRENRSEVFENKDYLAQIMEFMNVMVSIEIAANDWKDASAWTTYKSLEGHYETSWHKHGYKTFFDIMLNKYNNGPGLPTLEIKLNTEVTAITWPLDSEGSVRVATKNGAEYSASNVIVTVSLGVLKERHTTLFTSPLPKKKVVAIEQISMGVVGKVIFAFPYQWWPTQDTNYDFFWRSEDFEKVSKDDQWTLKVAGVSTPMANNYSLTFWTSGDAAKLVETLPEEVVKSKCMALLRQFMGANTTIPDPTHTLRSTWFSNPFTRGAYTYDNLQVSQHPEARADLASPLTDSTGSPRVLFAGEATNTLHYSTVHGASESGFREAMRVLGGADAQHQDREETGWMGGQVKMRAVGRTYKKQNEH